MPALPDIRFVETDLDAIDAHEGRIAVEALLRDLVALAPCPVLGVGAGIPGIVDDRGVVYGSGSCTLSDGDTTFQIVFTGVIEDDGRVDVGADLIVHETNYGAHTPYEKLAALPEAIRARMRLIHYPDDFDREGSVIASLSQGERVEVG